ncbi:DsbA family oxidoreductase [Cohaesibacter gelatinilyticus]|uniref:Predicted dithiol-disulfide isomerase, DsbA family n=1 Tax=Cohaesibacter gelatinilyticus TaxID=372072 RepID=A0A285N8R0_9HYPH|nr:DsbA family oxidoreductase [Cohaesibacter gelatinilyticus]SNZ05884.1 Predicted dithiol-disulfide isomerase, DsbA family [Cohaesibacter gelatinilyticus]HAT86875.1 DsbA family oxidoreductase [Hyphomicrobiales bacterium]
MTEAVPQSASNNLTLDIISDIACPWCAIGYYRLKAALDKMGLEAEIVWHPYEINPHLDAKGTNLMDNIIYKYGMTPDQVREMRTKLTGLGAEVGFSFNYTDDMQVQNSLRAHQLVHWAKQFGSYKSHAVKLALLEAFFTHRKNIADIEILAALATEQGLDGQAASEMLKQDALLAEVQAAASGWKQQGISGVPSIVANRKFLTTGAQPVDGYVQWLKAVKAQSPV